jgi:hypothetical protein
MIKIIAAIAIALALAGTGAYYYSSIQTVEDTAKNNERITEGAFAPTNTNNLSGTGDFRALLNMQDSVTCTVAYEVEGQGTFSGTVYVNEGKMRGDFSYNTQGEEMHMSVINDGSTGYTWGTTPMGELAMRYSIAQPDEQAEESQQAFDYDQRVTYSCAPWGADAAAFVPPSDINFMDVSSSIRIEGNDSSSVSTQCRTCEMITDPGPKEQCLAAFSCDQ